VVFVTGVVTGAVGLATGAGLAAGGVVFVTGVVTGAVGLATGAGLAAGGVVFVTGVVTGAAVLAITVVTGAVVLAIGVGFAAGAMVFVTGVVLGVDGCVDAALGARLLAVGVFVVAEARPSADAAEAPTAQKTARAVNTARMLARRAHEPAQRRFDRLASLRCAADGPIRSCLPVLALPTWERVPGGPSQTGGSRKAWRNVREMT
jgi:hypothetical protein